MTPPIRVLVVDDSAFARKVLRQVLSADRRIEVVGIARDGLDALEKIAELSPDVLTLDLVMPNLDGVGVLEALRERPSAPRAIVVTMSDAESPLGVAALTAGAFDVVHKPTALATDRLYELGEELVAKVVAAAEASRSQPRASGQAAPPARIARAKTRIVVVGASTGGPRAISLLLRDLPATFPVPLAVVVHMPPGYTEAFAQRLDGESALHVVEAAEGMVPKPGTALIARAGMHLTFEREAAHLDVRPIHELHRPSVDVLFKSAAAAYGDGVLAMVLTGMGSDGLAGAQAVRDAGGRVLVESAESCVVYGMPRSVSEAGLADAQLPLESMAAYLVANV